MTIDGGTGGKKRGGTTGDNELVVIGSKFFHELEGEEDGVSDGALGFEKCIIDGDQVGANHDSMCLVRLRGSKRLAGECQEGAGVVI